MGGRPAAIFPGRPSPSSRLTPRTSHLGPRRSRLRWIVTGVSFALAIGVSVYLMGSSWTAEGVDPRFTMPPWGHLLALAAVATEIGARALKVQLGSRALHVPISFGTALRMSLGGDFGAAITPARSGAEPARFLVLAEAGVPAAAILLVLFTEIFLEAFTLAAIAAGLALTFTASSAMVRGVTGTVLAYASFAIGAAVVGAMLARRNAHGPPPRWALALRLNAGRWRAVQRALRQLRTSLAGVRRARKRLLLAAFLVSVVHVLARLAVLPIIVWSLNAGAPLPALVLWPLALLYGSAVAPAPAGGGLVEVGFRAALGGTIPAFAFGASLLWWRFYTFYIYILLGALAAGSTVMRAVRNRETEHVPAHGARHRSRRGAA